jgi:hypothetical protein
MGCLLDVDLYPRQRLPSFLRVEHARLPHGVHQHPYLLYPLDWLDRVHAHALLASGRDGLCHCALALERFLYDA